MKGIIKIYDYLSSHRWMVGCLCSMLVVLLGWCAFQLDYKEDIFDFLPQNKEYTESMQVYSSLSEASRIVVIFEGNNPDSIILAIDAFSDTCPNAITEIEMDAFTDRLCFMHEHMPYFLTDAAYEKLEIVCDTSTDTITKMLYQDRQILSMPGTSFLQSSILSDPFMLIPIAKGISGQYAGAQSAFTSYDGYMMTVDRHRGFAFYDSPYGSTETKQNAALVDTLTQQIRYVGQLYPSLNIRLLGAPVIAVGNANQIKKDSFWAIGISLVLILLLLLYSFPRLRDILLIIISVGFGWLTGMSALYWCLGSVSAIVLGIGAILIGICINYPLHMLVHQRYTSSVRQTLQEVLSPLITGNITTVGAFVALIPLQSPALRQLGIFASSMLLGTIFFCVFILPHLMTDKPTAIREIHVPVLKNHKYGTYAAVVVSIILSIYVLLCDYPLFDANISHINYMTEQQKKDFAWFESISPISDEPTFLANSAKAELNKRLLQWNKFWDEHDSSALIKNLQTKGKLAGFREDAFNPFIQILTEPIQQLDLTNTNVLASVWPGRFDSEQMNKRVAQDLSGNFNYIGLVCSAIVLLFLCISFKNIWVGLIAFLPMVFSWGLIITIMQVFNLQFNIVNIILATFIFGQGDDYTIFVVEGLQYEQKYGKQILNQYKQSIVLSALVMLIAIGVLAFAKHPALQSLGVVTLIGMTCVVFMAFVVPPILYNLYNLINKSL